MMSHALLSDRTTLQEKLRLRIAIRQGLDELETIARRTLQLERELASFAEAYFDALGEMALAFSESASAESTTLADLTEISSERTQAMKTTYRQLMKTLHPDVAERDASETLAQVQRAYEANDLAGLLRIELEMLPPPVDAPNVTLAALETKLARIAQALGVWEAREHSLRDTALYACWQRARAAKLAGRNWIQLITDRLRRDIAQNRKIWVASHATLTPSVA